MVQLVFSVWIIISISNLYIFMSMKVKVFIRGLFSSCLYSGPYENVLIQFSVNYVLDSFLPFAIMLFLYRKMKKRMNTEENENTFALNEHSRQRNRRALRTIRGLLFLFTVTVIPVRVLYVLTTVSYFYASKSNPFSLPMNDALFFGIFSIVSFCSFNEQRIQYFRLRKNDSSFSKVFVDRFYILNVREKKIELSLRNIA